MIGKHLLIDFYGVGAQHLNDVELLTQCLQTAAQCAGLTPVASPLLHPFEGGGVTGFLLLAESHIALHTYPEHEYIAVDIFSCGAADPQAALAVFRTMLAPQREHVTSTPRGEEVK